MIRISKGRRKKPNGSSEIMCDLVIVEAKLTGLRGSELSDRSCCLESDDVDFV